ncbi:MAG: Uma2 family endonuclease [Microcoleus sp.]
MPALLGVGTSGVMTMALLTLPLKVNLDRVQFTDEQFYQLCLSNPELTIERDAEGRLIVMSPVGGDSGSREMDIAFFKYVRSPL